MVATAVGLNSQTGQIFSLLLDVKGQKSTTVDADPADGHAGNSKQTNSIYLCGKFILEYSVLFSKLIFFSFPQT